MLLPLVAFALATILSTLFTPFVRQLAERAGAVAVPRERDVHKTAVPRWGGIAMYAAFMITLGVVYVFIYFDRRHFPWGLHELRQFAGLLIGATIVAISGAVDDKYDLSPMWQALALTVAGAVLVIFDVRIDGVSNPFAHGLSLAPDKPHDPRTWIGFPKYIGGPLTILWVFLVAKTVDFMDGLDGLAAGISAISGATLALMAAQAGQYEVSIIAAAVVGVCVGFLRHNYNPASIIMGTVGAQFLGFILASIAIIGAFKLAAALSFSLPVIALGVPIFDGLRVVAQRTLNRTPAYKPDNTSHLHHILINHGMSQRQAVLVIYGIVTVLCAIALVVFRLIIHS
jgi:UDP-GlcNAc:undecaprenyl-phosphate/decaprenyl-phosphate GlcNAc-1-phosphate transferase